ncbi:MAG: hypothetical protein OEW18_06235, partial [Candidatus Aminicenantes bacterium]|nr:hypothetical protein [Candidatus Aminicenantes bacterium]
NKFGTPETRDDYLERAGESLEAFFRRNPVDEDLNVNTTYIFLVQWDGLKNILSENNEVRAKVARFFPADWRQFNRSRLVLPVPSELT